MKHTFKKLDDGFFPSDFKAFPFWAWCLMEDEGEEWFDDACPRTYRGVSDGLPLEVAQYGLYRTTVAAANGCKFPGIGRGQTGKLSLLGIFDEEGTISLTHRRDLPRGIDSGVANDIARLEKLCGASIEEIFPLKFSTHPSAISEKLEGQCIGIELVIFENRKLTGGEMFPNLD
jgi:hypothetical protein